MYKRILETNVANQLRDALDGYPEVKVRPTGIPASNSLLTEYAIEGPDKFRAVIDKATELFDCAVD